MQAGEDSISSSGGIVDVALFGASNIPSLRCAWLGFRIATLLRSYLRGDDSPGDRAVGAGKIKVPGRLLLGTSPIY